MKRKLQILGTGCAKCQRLEANARAAADALGIDYDLEKVRDVAHIAELGVAITPALAIDGDVKVAGHVASVVEIERLLA